MHGRFPFRVLAVAKRGIWKDRTWNNMNPRGPTASFMVSVKASLEATSYDLMLCTIPRFCIVDDEPSSL